MCGIDMTINARTKGEEIEEFDSIRPLAARGIRVRWSGRRDFVEGLPCSDRLSRRQCFSEKGRTVGEFRESLEGLQQWIIEECEGPLLCGEVGSNLSRRCFVDEEIWWCQGHCYRIGDVADKKGGVETHGNEALTIKVRYSQSDLECCNYGSLIILRVMAVEVGVDEDVGEMRREYDSVGPRL